MRQPADLPELTETEAPTEAPTVVTAEIAETFRWLTFGQLRGFVFSRGGVRLNGTITLHVGDEAASFESEWKRYSTSSATVFYTDKRDAKGISSRSIFLAIRSRHRVRL